MTSPYIGLFLPRTHCLEVIIEVAIGCFKPQPIGSRQHGNLSEVIDLLHGSQARADA